jgi:hypothetical protein
VHRHSLSPFRDESFHGSPTKTQLAGVSARSKITMRGVFVLHVRRARHGTPDARVEGSIEEVDTGKQLSFRSSDELVAFLCERLADADRVLPGNEGTGQSR